MTLREYFMRQQFQVVDYYTGVLVDSGDASYDDGEVRAVYALDNGVVVIFVDKVKRCADAVYSIG